MTKVTKMSFSSIQGVLSRDEMRKIMAGSGSSSCGTCTPNHPYEGPPETCMTDPTLQGACMGCGGLCR
jgi:hypothetical protein